MWPGRVRCRGGSSASQPHEIPCDVFADPHLLLAGPHLAPRRRRGRHAAAAPVHCPAVRLPPPPCCWRRACSSPCPSLACVAHSPVITPVPCSVAATPHRTPPSHTRAQVLLRYDPTVTVVNTMTLRDPYLMDVAATGIHDLPLLSTPLHVAAMRGDSAAVDCILRVHVSSRGSGSTARGGRDGGGGRAVCRDGLRCPCACTWVHRSHAHVQVGGSKPPLSESLLLLQRQLPRRSPRRLAVLPFKFPPATPLGSAPLSAPLCCLPARRPSAGAVAATPVRPLTRLAAPHTASPTTSATWRCWRCCTPHDP